MSKHKIIGFLLGFLTTALIFGIVSVLIMFLTFDLAGGETIEEIENLRLAILVLAIILSASTFLVAKSFFKSGRKSVARGIMVASVALIITVAYYFISNISYQTKFDKTTWDQSVTKPFGMARSIVRDNKLIGLSRQQVKEILGPGSEEYKDSTTQDGSIIYEVTDDWKLIIYFNKDKVTKTDMRRPWLGV